MHAILFPLGIVTTAAGFIAIGFGIPDKAFSFGNTLIIAGTIAAVGGLILIALASVVRQLNRIAAGDTLRPSAMSLATHSDDHLQPHPQPSMQVGQGVGMPLRMDAPPRAASTAEPKLTVSSTAEPDQLAWLRPKSATPTFGEQALIEEIEASLSPTASPPPPSSPPRFVSPGAAVSQTPQQKPVPQSQTDEPAIETSSAFRGEPAARSAPLVEHPNPSGLFDTVWPEVRTARDPETIARARKPDTIAPPREDGKAAKDAPRETQAPVPTPAPVQEGPRPVAILKSGMIDGMAYTLYADGSIEAVLASGPIKFASIDALRLHLEKNG